MEIIPVINCPDFECVVRKVGAAEKFSQWAHLDVADGVFTFNKSWGDPQGWQKLKSALALEVHLMVAEPERAAAEWLTVGAKRLIVHAETASPDTAARIAEAAKARGASLMVAANPETPAEKLASYFEICSEFQILAVYPGPAGQKFLPVVLDKIQFLRERLPDVRIEIDGGVRPETVPLVKAAGATVAVAGTFIFGDENPRAAYEKLQAIAR